MRPLFKLVVWSFLGGLTAVGAPQDAKETKVDLSKATSEVEFLATATPGGMHIRGELSKEAKSAPVSGNLLVKGNNLTGKVKLMLDAFDTGIGIRNKHMKEKYLEVEKFPEANLAIQTLSVPSKAKDEKTPFTGTLTLHGQTHPVKGEATVNRDDKKLNLELQMKVALTEYGIEAPVFMGIRVADIVEVRAQVKSDIE